MNKCLHSDLSDGSVFSKDVVHLLRRDLVGQVTNVQHPVHLGGQSNLKNNKFVPSSLDTRGAKKGGLLT